MWRCVNGYVVLGVSKKHVAFIFRSRRSTKERHQFGILRGLYLWLKATTSFETLGGGEGGNFPSNSTLGWRQHLPSKRWEPLTQQLYPWLKTAPSFQTLGTTYPATLPLVEDSNFLSNVWNHLPSNGRLTPQDRDPQQHGYGCLTTRYGFVVIRNKSLNLYTVHSCRMEFGFFADVFWTWPLKTKIWYILEALHSKVVDWFN
jgi:hypothetical protein